MGSLGVNVPALIVVGISLVIGLLMVVVFRYTSDQKAIHDRQGSSEGAPAGATAFSGSDPRGVALVRSHSCVATGRYLRLAFKPLLFVIVPLTISDCAIGSLSWVDAGGSGAPISDEGAHGQCGQASNEASLQLPDGLATTAPAVHVPAENEVAWRVVAEKAGDYVVNVQASEADFLEATWWWGPACSVCRQCACAGNSGSVFLFLGEPALPREQSSSSQSRYSILPGRSLSPGSNGTGSGCSLFCPWRQVSFSRVFLGLRYEVAPQQHSPS